MPTGSTSLLSSDSTPEPGFSTVGLSKVKTHESVTVPGVRACREHCNKQVTPHYVFSCCVGNPASGRVGAAANPALSTSTTSSSPYWGPRIQHRADRDSTVTIWPQSGGLHCWLDLQAAVVHVTSNSPFAAKKRPPVQPITQSSLVPISFHLRFPAQLLLLSFFLPFGLVNGLVNLYKYSFIYINTRSFRRAWLNCWNTSNPFKSPQPIGFPFLLTLCMDF